MHHAPAYFVNLHFCHFCFFHRLRMLPGASHRLIFSLHSSLEDSRFMHVTVSVSVRNCVQELVLHQCLVTNFVAVEQQHPHSFSRKLALLITADVFLEYSSVSMSSCKSRTGMNHGHPWTILDGFQVSSDVSTLPLDANTPAVEVKLQAWSKSHPQPAPCSRGYRLQQKATEESHLRCPGHAQLIDLPSLRYLVFSSYSPGL